MFPGSGEELGVRGFVSNSIHIQEIGIHTPSIAIRNRATRIDIRATATDSRETGIYSQAIATYSREIASDSQEMAVNIEGIDIYCPRTAAGGLETARTNLEMTTTCMNSRRYAAIAENRRGNYPMP